MLNDETIHAAYAARVQIEAVLTEAKEKVRVNTLLDDADRLGEARKAEAEWVEMLAQLDRLTDGPWQPAVSLADDGAFADWFNGGCKDAGKTGEVIRIVDALWNTQCDIPEQRWSVKNVNSESLVTFHWERLEDSQSALRQFVAEAVYLDGGA